MDDDTRGLDGSRTDVVSYAGTSELGNRFTRRAELYPPVVRGCGMNGAGWFVAYTKPASEERVKAWLEEHDRAEIYYPIMEKQVAHAGSVKTVHRPVFPRYIFLRGVPLHRARNTPGIVHLIRVGLKFVLVSDTVIDEMKSLEKDGIMVLPDITKDKGRPLRKGEKVRVEDGPFAGTVAVYQGMSSNDRVSVLLSILRRSLRVDLPSGSIRRLK